jgi:predicted Rossmann-fold nucleotide-binding protein
MPYSTQFTTAISPQARQPIPSLQPVFSAQQPKLVNKTIKTPTAGPRQPEMLSLQLKPKGLYRTFLTSTLWVAKAIETGILPKLAYLAYVLTHPRASAKDKAHKKAEFQNCFKTSPHSLTNRTYRRLYPRELGISVYGTARSNFKDPRISNLKTLSEQVGAAIADWGYFPITGGGPGVMYDVCVGAKSKGGHTAAAAIPSLNTEPQNFDANVFDEVAVHRTFPHRLTGPSSFIHRSPRTLVLPGGIGTHREALSVTEDAHFNLTSFPAQKQAVFLDPNGFYDDFRQYLNSLVATGTVSPKQLDAFVFVKTLEEAKAALFNPSTEWSTGIENRHHRSISFKK